MSIENGFGKTLNVTNVAQVISFNTLARKASVFNQSAATIYIAMNATAAELVALVAASEAIPLPAGQTFSFDFDNPTIQSVALVAAAAGPYAASVGAY